MSSTRKTQATTIGWKSEFVPEADKPVCPAKEGVQPNLQKRRPSASQPEDTVHLARAVNTPVVGLYAVANPLLTGPYRALDFSINKHGEALKKFRGGSKNSIHSRIHLPEAMELITVNEVIVQVERVLEFLSFPVYRD